MGLFGVGLGGSLGCGVLRLGLGFGLNVAVGVRPFFGTYTPTGLDFPGTMVI